MSSSSSVTDLPSLTYLEGSSGPAAIVTCPGAGNLADMASVVVLVADGYPGGVPIFTLGTPHVVPAPDQVTVTWSAADLGALDAGEYGMTVAATDTDGHVLKWRGLLRVDPAS